MNKKHECTGCGDWDCDDCGAHEPYVGPDVPEDDFPVGVVDEVRDDGSVDVSLPAPIEIDHVYGVHRDSTDERILVQTRLQDGREVGLTFWRADVDFLLDAVDAVRRGAIRGVMR